MCYTRHPGCAIADKRVGPGTEPDTERMPSSPDGTVTMLHHPPSPSSAPCQHYRQTRKHSVIMLMGWWLRLLMFDWILQNSLTGVEMSNKSNLITAQTLTAWAQFYFHFIRHTYRRKSRFAIIFPATTGAKLKAVNKRDVMSYTMEL